MTQSKKTTPPQSAADKRAAEAELQMLIERYSPEHLRLIGAVRRSLRRRLPTTHEVVYEYRDFLVISFSPSGNGYEGVLGIRADGKGVRLYFNGGKDLPDPDELLQGSAQARWMDLPSVSTLSKRAVVTLLKEAIARSRVPFARTGRGSVVVRLTSAKKRRER